MDRKEETRLKALQNKIEEKAQEYKDKYSLLLDEARKEAEQAKREAEQTRREAEQARREAEEAEIEHQKALKLCEETRRRTARIRTAANREVPDGTIGSIVKTEWGDLFNIAQTPS